MATKVAWDEAGQSVKNLYRLRPMQTYQPESELSSRYRVWRLFDDPASGRTAQALGTAMIGLICLSSTAFILETVPELDWVDETVWNMIERLCVAAFTVEFTIRVACCPDLAKFVKDPLNLVDFLAIVPYYIETLTSNDGNTSSSAIFRILRLVRIFRVFKISRYVTWVGVFNDAIMASAHPLAMLVYIMAVALVVFGTAMHYAERGRLDRISGAYLRADGTSSPFFSIPASFWWCIITMTTVGYGDDVPVTTLGRFIAAITSLCGVLVLAIPITIISANFNSELNKMVRQKDVDFVRLLALKEDVERAYWDRARVEAKLLKGMESAWCDQDGRYFTEANVAPDKRALFKELGAANRSIQGARYRFTQFTEEQIFLVIDGLKCSDQQIQSIVTKNLTDLMKQISDTIQRQKSVSANQIKSILEVIPKFRSEPNPWCATPPEWMATATRRNTQTRTTDYPVHKNSNK